MTSITDEFEYNSEEDEDFVPDGNASDDGGGESEFEEEYDENGNKINTKSRKTHQRKRKLTLEEKIAQGARKRATLEKINKQNKFRIGAAVLSDDEEELINNNNNNNDDKIEKSPDVIMKQEENIPLVKSEPNNDKTNSIKDNKPDIVSPSNEKTNSEIEQKSVPINNNPTTPPTMSLSQMLSAYNKPKPKTTTKPKVMHNFWDSAKKPESISNTTTSTPSEPTTTTTTMITETATSTPSLATETSNSMSNGHSNINILRDNIPVSISGNQVTVTELSTFAGEAVEITKTFTKGSTAEKEYNANRSSKKGKDNLDFIIASLSGKRAMTTLDKTKLDWQKDKAIEGDQHELQQFTKNGYVAKQAFLAQSDAKQYETIKAMQKQAQKKSINYAVDVD